ncbi:hypothetical protein [Sphingomonas hengshuiensis]|uniref:hypothetical protein n=1 Tax=Sphingomonas hengshuiensis TaxID=1609977 RepID=UPI0005CB403C|nr:hypothetical protein [Sphingomonas hengshuiensis]
MTKLRAPASIEEALQRIAVQIPGGLATMAQRIDRQPGTLRAWADPDRVEQLPLPCAIELDLLFQEHGGAGAPCFETYGFQLDQGRATRFASEIELARCTIAVVKEAGEAGAALIVAGLPGATHADRAAAFKEIAELDGAIKRVLPHITPDREAPP